MATRDDNVDHLHPEVRTRVQRVLGKMRDAGIPFALFEGFRSPDRQQYLYEQGRTRPGPRVTNATPWQSYHQYGLAADLVLLQDGQWDWGEEGPKAGWWNQMHQAARNEGMEPLSWEMPHLQLAGLSVDQMHRGEYPPGGDQAWAENLEGAIAAWHGAPAAPPAPKELAVRPALDVAAAPPVLFASGVSSGGSSWHNPLAGQLWRYDSQGVYLASHDGGVTPLRTNGNPITCRAILDLMQENIFSAARKFDVPVAIIMMTIAAETADSRAQGFTGPRTFRWEPNVDVTDVSPPTKGDYSAGPMQTLASTARWVIRVQHLSGYEPFDVAPAYRQQPSPPPAEHPLYGYGANIEIGSAEIRQRWPVTGDDPILVAAAYNAGGIYPSDKNPWGMRCYGDHLDRAARWYGDACFVLRERGYV